MRRGVRERSSRRPRNIAKRNARPEPIPVETVAAAAGDVEADARSTFDIGESPSEQPTATFDAWPVDAQSEAAVEDPTAARVRASFDGRQQRARDPAVR